MPQKQLSPGINKAHTESVLLTFWGAPCSSSKKKFSTTQPLHWHWSDRKPTIREAEITCLGSLIGTTSHAFEVHGILPQCLMPRMDIAEQMQFLEALERKLTKKMGISLKRDIQGKTLKRDLVDWDGVNRIH